MGRTFEKIKVRATFLLRGHLLNPLWQTRKKRRQIRQDAQADMVTSYLKRCYRHYESRPAATGGEEPERIYTLWLQGEENAPEIVKACFRSIRKQCSQELVILDLNSLKKYVNLPETVLQKYKEGKISPAGFSDICRAEILRAHGGFWLDSTCLVCSPIPEWIEKEPFFVYSAEGVEGYEYSIIQSCFIHARRGNELMRRWADLFMDYWMHESGAMDYFQFHLTLKALLEMDDECRRMFEKMPQLNQRLTHLLQLNGLDKPYDEGYFKEMTSGAFFQKLTYRSNGNSPEGSYFDVISRL